MSLTSEDVHEIENNIKTYKLGFEIIGKQYKEVQDEKKHMSKMLCDYKRQWDINEKQYKDVINSLTQHINSMHAELQNYNTQKKELDNTKKKILEISRKNLSLKLKIKQLKSLLYPHD